MRGTEWICLATIMVKPVINTFLCHHPLRSTLDKEFSGNRLRHLGIASELALIAFILYAPAGNWLFGTAPISGVARPGCSQSAARC